MERSTRASTCSKNRSPCPNCSPKYVSCWAEFPARLKPQPHHRQSSEQQQNLKPTRRNPCPPELNDSDSICHCVTALRGNPRGAKEPHGIFPVQDCSSTPRKL